MRTYPTIEEVSKMAADAVTGCMSPKTPLGTGSTKSAPGQWFLEDVKADRAYNLMRAMKHGTQYWNIQAGTEIDPSGETARDHLVRMVTRAAMELAVYDSEK